MKHFDDTTIYKAGQLFLRIQEVNHIGSRIGLPGTLYPYADLTVSPDYAWLVIRYGCEVVSDRNETMQVTKEWIDECHERLDELAELRRKIYGVKE